MRLRAKDRGSCGDVTENSIVLGAEAGEAIWMFRKEVEGEDRTGRCGVVTCENEKLDLRHSEVFELVLVVGLIFGRDRRILGKVRVESEINDGFVLWLVFVLNIFVSVVELTREKSVHPIGVVSMNHRTYKIEVFQRIDFDSYCAPLDLFPQR